MKTYYLIAFILMSLSQAYVPVSMILEHENILSSGMLYKFKCRPADPNDPFRGKYVQLDFEAATCKMKEMDFEIGQQVFVLLENDPDGFAVVKNLSADRFSSGDYFQATVRYIEPESIVLEFPFNRYYLEESKAQAAEDVYREKSTEAVAHVYVKNGNSVLKSLMIGNKTIEDAASEFKNSSEVQKN